MLSKTLFLAVLLCAVVVANAGPHHQNGPRVKREAANKVKVFLTQQREKIEKHARAVGHAVKSFWNRLTGKESAQQRKVISELKTELDRVNKESVQILKNKDAYWSNLLEDERRKLEQANAQNARELAAANEELGQVQAKYDNEINNVIKHYNDRIANLGQKIVEVIQSQ